MLAEMTWPEVNELRKHVDLAMATMGKRIFPV